tara:strand:- start:1578 stop:1832 length:255 start_codon:yes stop_codon:yes gene_type:complete
MKLFIYKTLFAAFVFFILFQITIGAAIKEMRKQISYFSSEENIISIKNKIREEIKSANKKDRYLEAGDALLLKQFLEKIKSELK